MREQTRSLCRHVRVIGVLGAVAMLGGNWNVVAAEDCPTVADPRGIKTAAPYQIDRPDFEKQAAQALDLRENPLFAARVMAGELPPVEQRLPEEALVCSGTGVGHLGDSELAPS